MGSGRWGLRSRVSPQGVTRHPRVGHDTSRIHFPRTRTNSSMPPAASVKARCASKAPSEPLIRGATGGEVRRSCLSGRSPRVLRRPPVVSSARQSAGQAKLEQTAGSAGAPFLPTSLATQRSGPAAGPGTGQRNTTQRKAVGLHQRTANNRVCKPGRGTRPGQRNPKQRKAAGLHQRPTCVVQATPLTAPPTPPPPPAGRPHRRASHKRLWSRSAGPAPG